MKKICVFVAVVMSALSVSAQGLIRDVNTEQFPLVTVCVESYNPDSITANQIHLFEGGVEVSVKKDSIASKPIGETAKTNVLVLWDQRDPVVLSYVSDLFEGMKIAKGNNADIKANVSVFRRNENRKMDYKKLANAFSSKMDELRGKVLTEGEREDQSVSQTIDLGYVLTNAISQISECPANEAKAIVLYSVGKMSGESGSDMSKVVSMAKEKRIQIYVVNINGSDVDEDLSRSLSSDTYGQYINSNSGTALNQWGGQKSSAHAFYIPENERVCSWITNLPKRWSGREYVISFTSNESKRTGENKSLKVDLANDSVTGTYSIPNITFGYWIKTHLILFICLLVVLLAGIGVGVFFLIRWLRDVAEERKEEADKISSERKRMKSEQEMLRRRVEASESERQRKIEEEASREKDQQRQEQLANINQIMRQKNIQARLMVSTMTGLAEHTIDTAECTIGSASDNMVVINDSTVSRHHALLYFNGEGFVLKDLNSTNGIVMNGIKVKDVKLRNGDQLSLGKTMIKIYF
ncbi:MAG: FHA domain-containing protein [Bacteroidales bacterium]|nr:FHA domain-containing protein [Bacteroidales bacterium]